MEIQNVLDASNAVAERGQFVRAIGRHRFDNAVKSGQLVAVFPRAYARPWDVDLPDIQARAALASVGGDVALSHLTALASWELPVADVQPVHVTAFQPRHPRGVPERLVVHRTLLPLDAIHLDGFPVVRLETALITSWPLLAGPAQRAPMIEAWRRRLLHAGRLGDLAERSWWIRGIVELRQLVGLLLAGCESELEMFGYTDVFNVAGLHDANRQRVVVADGKRYRLDIAYDDVKLNVELDGREFHASPDRWAADIARDLALAKLGWQTIRLSHSRLFSDVAGCRRDVLAVRAARSVLAS